MRLFKNRVNPGYVALVVMLLLCVAYIHWPVEAHGEKRQRFLSAIPSRIGPWDMTKELDLTHGEKESWEPRTMSFAGIDEATTKSCSTSHSLPPSMEISLTIPKSVIRARVFSSPAATRNARLPMAAFSRRFGLSRSRYREASGSVLVSGGRSSHRE